MEGYFNCFDLNAFYSGSWLLTPGHLFYGAIL
jgi:hypothetical protein